MDELELWNHSAFTFARAGNARDATLNIVPYNGSTADEHQNHDESKCPTVLVT